MEPLTWLLVAGALTALARSIGAESIELTSEWLNVWVGVAMFVLGVVGVIFTQIRSTRQLRKNGGTHVADLPAKLDELVVHVAVLTEKMESVDQRTERLERQVDDVIIPKQERIVRRVDAD